jgi:hypothetical protein
MKDLGFEVSIFCFRYSVEGDSRLPTQARNPSVGDHKPRLNYIGKDYRPL